MAKQHVFISFDFDHDADLRDHLVAQSKHPESPFSMVDCSVRAAYDARWRQRVRSIIRDSDLTIVICGEHTDMARGVAAELTIVQEERKPYFLLQGRPHRLCTKPKNALKSDRIHDWSWLNLHNLIYARG